MKVTLTMRITHRLSCGACSYETGPSTIKWANFWFLLHKKFFCDSPARDLPFLKTLWGLIRWKPGTKS